MKGNSKTKSKPVQSLNKYPSGWNRKKIQQLIKHYENQTEEQAAAEDEAAFNDPEQAVVLVPRELLPKVQKLLAGHAARR